MKTCKINNLKNSSITALFLLLIVSFIMLNIASGLFFNKFKLDVSKNKIYSLSEETYKLLDNLSSQVNVRFFISEDLEDNYPELGQYATYIMRYLEEYKHQYNNLFEIEVINVTPFSPSEKDATTNKIRGFVGRDGRTNLYFGLVFSDSLGKRKIIPYINPERQNNLEQDITRILASFKQKERKTIGIVSPTLPVMNSGTFMDNNKDWAFIRILSNDYDLKKLSNNDYEIADYDAVIVLNPQKLSSNMSYAIDQYLMRDGKLIIFMDPFAEMDISANNIISPDNSNLTPFLKHWGINYQDNVIVGDDNLAEYALLGLNRIGEFPYWMELTPSQMNLQSINAKNLNKLNFKTAGIIEVNNPFEKNKLSVLLSTTNQGGVSRSDFVKYNPRDVSKQAFQSDNLQYNIGVISEGRFMSNYSRPLVDNFELLLNMKPFRMISGKNSKLLVVADSDFLATANWSNNFISDKESIYDLIPKNNNMDFLLSIVDYMTDNKDFPVISKNISNTTQDSIEKKLNKEYTGKRSEEITVLTNKILYTKSMIKDIEKSRNIIEVADNSFLEKLEKYKHELASSEEKLKEIDYQINQEIKIFIWINILVFPLILLLIVKVIAIIYSSKNQKRARSIC